MTPARTLNIFFVIWEEAFGRRHLGEGIWGRHLGEGIWEETSGRRHLGGGIWEEASEGRHLGELWEGLWGGSGKALGGLWEGRWGLWRLWRLQGCLGWSIFIKWHLSQPFAKDSLFLFILRNVFEVPLAKSCIWQCLGIPGSAEECQNPSRGLLINTARTLQAEAMFRKHS